MQIGVMKARPPHVKFKTIPLEDRTASVKAGRPMYKNIHYVVLTALGSKDSVEKPVDEWLQQVDQQVSEERMPPDWAEKFRSAFEHWLRGEEMPVEGTPLSTWPSLSPAELLNCKGIHILTVEDLANANAEAVRRLGMGGLDLKQRAARYLEAASGPGALLAENSALKQKVADQSARLEAIEARLLAAEQAVPGAKSPVKAEAAPAGIEEKL